MSIATVVTRGYGGFAGVNWLPTFGYTIGAPPLPSHWHDLQGASSQLYILIGGSTERYELAGPSSQLYISVGGSTEQYELAGSSSQLYILRGRE